MERSHSIAGRASERNIFQFMETTRFRAAPAYRPLSLYSQFDIACDGACHGRISLQKPHLLIKPNIMRPSPSPSEMCLFLASSMSRSLGRDFDFGLVPSTFAFVRRGNAATVRNPNCSYALIALSVVVSKEIGLSGYSGKCLFIWHSNKADANLFPTW
jgi:hypothetical protein